MSQEPTSTPSGASPAASAAPTTAEPAAATATATATAAPLGAHAESSNRVQLGWSNRLLARPEVGALVAAVILFIFFLIVAPAFRSVDSLMTVLYQSARRSASWPWLSAC